MPTRPSLVIPLFLAAVVGGLVTLVATWSHGWQVSVPAAWAGATVCALLVGPLAVWWRG